MERRDAETQRSEPREEINQWTSSIIGAAIEVHRGLGPGFLESIYEEAMAVELALRGHLIRRQVRLPIEYKGTVVGEHRLDMLLEDEVVVELKAVEAIMPVHLAQLHSYLKAGAFEVGLLINFNVPILKNGIRRILLKTPLF